MHARRRLPEQEAAIGKEATLQLLEAFVTHTRQQRWQASKRSEWHIRYAEGRVVERIAKVVSGFRRRKDGHAACSSGKDDADAPALAEGSETRLGVRVVLEIRPTP